MVAETDHAGIATQSVVERKLRSDGVMKHRDDLGQGEVARAHLGMEGEARRNNH